VLQKLEEGAADTPGLKVVNRHSQQQEQQQEQQHEQQPGDGAEGQGLQQQGEGTVTVDAAAQGMQLVQQARQEQVQR
jgi:hypothetical protein